MLKNRISISLNELRSFIRSTISSNQPAPVRQEFEKILFFFFRDLFAQARVALPEFGRVVLSEVGCFEYGADFNFLSAIEGRPFEPLDRFIHRAHLPHPIAADQLFRFRERTVDHRSLLPENFTRFAFEVGCNPSPASMMPAFTSC